MSFDGLMLGHVITDLKNHILNNRITKIYQLSSNDLLFQTRGARNHIFIMSTSPQYTRLHRTSNTYDKPMHPPMFCMFLRKHLEGAEILDIKQHGNDRIATFFLKTRNEMGDLTHKYLIFEALGKDANIVVTDENFKILEALKHSGPFDETTRTITPTALYEYPHDTRINPFDKEARNHFLNTQFSDSIRDYLNAFSGVSPQFIKEFLFRTTSKGDAVNIFSAMLDEQNYQYTESPKALFSFYSLTHIQSTPHKTHDVAELFDAFFYERDRTDKLRQSAKDLHQFVKRQLDKNKDKLEKLKKDLTKTDALDGLRLQGEMIQSFRHQIKRGDRTLECINYYTNEPLSVPLDPKKSVTENSEAYFKKYKKIKASVPYVKREIKKAENEIEYFYILEDQLAHADLNDLEEIREELEQLNYMKKRKKKTKQKRKKTYTTFIDEEGVEIIVGKNNQQNSTITHEIAQHFHVWFHVKDAPGSHVVVKAGLPLSETTIRTAAQLASYFSKMRESSSVPVDYTEIRHVKKIPGKHASLVRFTNQKTIYIDPDVAFIKALNKSRH